MLRSRYTAFHFASSNVLLAKCRPPFPLPRPLFALRVGARPRKIKLRLKIVFIFRTFPFRFPAQFPPQTTPPNCLYRKNHFLRYFRRIPSLQQQKRNLDLLLMCKLTRRHFVFWAGRVSGSAVFINQYQTLYIHRGSLRDQTEDAYIRPG